MMARWPLRLVQRRLAQEVPRGEVADRTCRNCNLNRCWFHTEDRTLSLPQQPRTQESGCK